MDAAQLHTWAGDTGDLLSDARDRRGYEFDEYGLAAFAALVRAAALEEAAGICEDYFGAGQRCEDCAERIRAAKE